MALTITGELISSDQTAHAAWLASGHRHAWEVSWLPGWYMSQDTAITAMLLADAVAATGAHPGHRLWPHIEAWAGDLGLTAPDAVAWAAQPPGQTRGNNTATGPSGPQASQDTEP
jgi:hypothetical protein